MRGLGTATPGGGANLTWVIDELEAAVEAGEYDQAVRSLAASSPLFLEWGIDAGLDRIESVLRTLETYRPGEPWVLHLLAWVWFNRHQYQVALTTLNQAQSAFESARDSGDESARLGQFLCRLAIGMANWADGRSVDAKAAFDQALASGYLDRSPNPWTPDEQRWVDHDPSGFLAFWLTARAVFNEMGLRVSAARAYHNIGNVVLDRGEPSAARLLLERALELKRSGASQLSAALTLNTLGCAERHLGLLHRAVSHLEEAAAITRDHEHRTHLSYALNNLAEVHGDLSDVARAIELYDESIQLKELDENTFGLAYSWASMADLWLRAGDATKAADLMERACRLRLPGAGHLEEGRLLAGRARTELVANGWSEAIDRDLRAAIDGFMTADAKTDLMVAHWWLADALRSNDQTNEAIEEMRSALTIAEAHHLEHVLAQHAVATAGLVEAAMGELLEHPLATLRSVASIIERSPWTQNPGQSGGASIDVKARLFGPLMAELGGHRVPIESWRSRKAVSLLTMLLHLGGDPLHRDTAAEWLWPGAEPGKASRSLNVALSAVRRGLDDVLPGGGDLIERQGTYYRIAAAAVLTTDVTDFRGLYREVSTAERAGDLSVALGSAEQALEIVTGVYLADELYAEWPSGERNRLNELVLDVRVRAADWCLRAGDTSGAVFHATAALAADPWRERAWSALVRAHADGGDRAAALRAYERCRQTFEDELGMKPSPELSKLADELKG